MNSIGHKSPRPRLRHLALGAAAAAALALGAGHFALTKAAETAPAPAPAPQVPNVTIAHPEVRDVVEWDEFTGRFEAVDSVEVRARVSGYLEAVAFKDGAVVSKGDLLFKIDPRPFEAELEAAKADLANAAAALQNAKSEDERGRRLLAREALSKEEADRRTSARRQAEAASSAAKARVRQAELNLEFSEIRAPVSGRVSDNFVSDGNLIVGGPQNGTLLTTIVSADPIYFEFTASEADYLKYQRLGKPGENAGLEDGAPAFVKLLDESGFVREGAIDFVDNRLDPSTGTMRGRAIFENPDGVLVPGMFGRLKLAGTPERKAVLIADSAVQTDQTVKFVWLAGENNFAERREVKLGPLYEGRRIVREGLSPDDRVITSGAQFVAAGAPVTPRFEKESKFAEADRNDQRRSRSR